MIKVKDNRGLVRDHANNALLAVDREALLEYRRKVAAAGTMQTACRDIENLKSEVAKIDNDIQEIKSLLLQVLSK